MFIDLLDALRCPADHDETWLVARIDKMAGRYIAEGSLGCPVCRREYAIRKFVTYFTESFAASAPVEPVVLTTDDRLTRVAALLDLGAPGGFVGLAGNAAEVAIALALAFDVQTVLLNPPFAVEPSEGCSVVRCGGRAPLAAGSLRALAYDKHVAADEALVTSLVRAVRSGGRVLAPEPVPRPDGVRELARDEKEWVGVAETPSPFIPLSRRGSGSSTG